MVMHPFQPFQRRLTAAFAVLATLAVSGVASVAVQAPAASAATVVPCSVRQLSTPFARWGDSHSYFLMPNGGFESGTTGWGISGGARVGLGNESYFANSWADSHSLVLPAGAAATSQTICVGRGESSFRLFVRNPGVYGAMLTVQVSVQDPYTGRTVRTAFSVSASGPAARWSPTVSMHVPNLLGGTTGTQNLTIVIGTAGQPATWSVDDVFVDPLKLR